MPYSGAAKHTDSWQLPPMGTGDLYVTLASNNAEVELAQALRYDVFVNEIGAKPSPEAKSLERDFDEFDDICDHLLVIDKTLIDTPKNPVVGTYRLIRGSTAKILGKFYSESEYDITNIKVFDDDILELGRSCIHGNYRSKATMQLLLRGIGAYINHHGVKLMFGCASFHGKDVEPIKEELSYLYHYHLAPEQHRTVALPELYINMNHRSKDEIKPKEILKKLPPLIKGYLGMGAYVGDGAVYDSVCNTIDVSIIVKTDRLNDGYMRRFVSE